MHCRLLVGATLALTTVATSAGLARRSSGHAKPIAIPPAQNWDGDDGPWSSFDLEIGTPPQNVRVLISTVSPDIWVTGPDVCNASDTQCAQNRGQIFTPRQSSSWVQDGTFLVDLDPAQAVNMKGVWGNDTISLGLQGSGGPTLKSQTLGTFVSQDEYFGMFGVSPASTNFTPTNAGHPSYMTSLKQQGVIPSLSFAYTAGNQYRLRQVYGNLVLGGYDASLFTPNDLSVKFSNDPTRPLLVNLQNVVAQNQSGQHVPLLSDPIAINVDTGDSMIWLPVAACQAFEKAFGLTWSANSNLYLVDDDLHSALQQQNTSVTFTLGNQTSGGPTVDITLPYNSFDLSIKPPHPGVNHSQSYFPLRRATNESQYTLGRMFFQESYLIVDWERRNFSISECVFSNAPKAKLVTITSTTASSKKLSVGADVGIAIGVVVGVALILALIIALFLRRRRRANARKNTANPAESTILQGFAKGELGTGIDEARFEMPGSDPSALKVPHCVDEKARSPGTHSSSSFDPNAAEIDGKAAAMKAELYGSDSPHVVGGASEYYLYGGKVLHEMYDPSSIRPVELSASTQKTRRTSRMPEMEGSTPSSSPHISPDSGGSPSSPRDRRGIAAAITAAAAKIKHPHLSSTSSPLSGGPASSELSSFPSSPSSPYPTTSTAVAVSYQSPARPAQRYWPVSSSSAGKDLPPVPTTHPKAGTAGTSAQREGEGRERAEDIISPISPSSDADADADDEGTRGVGMGRTGGRGRFRFTGSSGGSASGSARRNG